MEKIYKKIWVFGDSYSAPYSDFHNQFFGPHYIEWKGYEPLIYPNIISKRLFVSLENLSRGGLDNYSIFERVCERIEDIGPNDIVIIGWSSVIRHRMITKSDNPLSIVESTLEEDLSTQFDFVSKTTLEEISVNRMDNKYHYEYELYQWSKLINLALPHTKIIHWSWDGLADNYTTRYQTIKTETDGIINDHHLSEQGHQQLANTLIKMINDKDTTKHYLGKFTTTKEKIEKKLL